MALPDKKVGYYGTFKQLPDITVCQQLKMRNQQEKTIYWVIGLALIAFIIGCLTLIFSDAAWPIVFTIFNIGATIIIAMFALGLMFLMIAFLLSKIEEFKRDIENQIKALQETLTNINSNFGAEILTVLSGLMIFLTQEAFNSDTFNKIVITITLTVNAFFSERLIRDGKWRRVAGILTFTAPYIAIYATLSSSKGTTFLLDYLQNESMDHIILVILTILFVLLSFLLSFSKKSGT